MVEMVYENGKNLDRRTNMQIDYVKLKGFRNFKEATVKFTQKSLIIGSNDIGKSNLLYALRLLLDKSLSEANLEPQDSDFYAYEDTNEIEILIKFQDINAECVLSKLKEHVNNAGVTYLAYKATRDKDSKRKDYRILVGREPELLEEVDSRFYLRVLNLRFIGSKRDLGAYIKQQRKHLIQDAKEERTDDEKENDTTVLDEIETKLSEIDANVAKLTYINKSTTSINTELKKLSFHNTTQNIVFDTGASKPEFFVDNLELASRVKGKTLTIGGEGRNNQIHLALWAARNKQTIIPDDSTSEEISIFCIEEPEAHLHPHQQRKLAIYLAETLEAQVLITTHSPQIANEFPPSSIIRLYNNNPDTLAAGNGSNPFIESAFIEFGYRLNIIPAEAFFSNVVLLVEGPSEELFYKALSNAVGVDLDNLNISVLMVDGVGFEPYISLLASLKIAFVMRTDNDIFKIPKKDEHRFAGIQRCLGVYQKYCEKDDEMEKVIANSIDSLTGFPDKENPPDSAIEAVDNFKKQLEKFGIYVADVDLEHDLQNSLIGGTIAEFVNKSDDEEIVAEMQKRKATFMFAFLAKHSDVLQKLNDDPLTSPLYCCKKLVEAMMENFGDELTTDSRTDSNN